MELLTNLQGILYLFIFLGALVGLFLLFRMIILWYYKIDIRVQNSEKMINELKQLVIEQRKTNTLLTQQIKLLECNNDELTTVE